MDNVHFYPPGVCLVTQFWVEENIHIHAYRLWLSQTGFGIGSVASQLELTNMYRHIAEREESKKY